MTANSRLGFGIAAASMTAAWIWAASFYVASPSGYWLSSTADSDLAALSAIVMTDVYAGNLVRGKADPRRMLWVGQRSP